VKQYKQLNRDTFRSIRYPRECSVSHSSLALLFVCFWALFLHLNPPNSCTSVSILEELTFRFQWS